ncbi:MAG TPA: M20 family metallopeptidase [Acidimicrobiia bacterium]
MSRKEEARRAFESVEADLRGISRWMYDNPETGYREYQSSKRLAERLALGGFEVTYPAYGLETAFEANIGTDGPRVVICCEYDALPEVGHACGHNIIATAAVGAGLALVPLVEDLGIRVTVLGTPAEEGGGGKVELIDAGAFQDAAAAMMVHPSPTDTLDPSFQTRRTFRVEYFGQESHAAFAPHMGVNALDAFVQAYLNVSTLRQHLLSGDRIHCMIEKGGDAYNVIAGSSRSIWGVRAETDERLEELVPRVRACFEAAAKATGCRLEIDEVDHPYLMMRNNPVMTELFAANSETLGRPMPTEAEVGRSGGSSDMGNVSQVVPSIHPMISIETQGAVNHQKEFAAATVTPSGDRAIRDGALGMAWTIIDLAEQGLWDQLSRDS